MMGESASRKAAMMVAICVLASTLRPMKAMILVSMIWMSGFLYVHVSGRLALCPQLRKYVASSLLRATD